MRAGRVRDGRSRSPPRMRMRIRDHQYSPPPVQDRQYATRISGHQLSPPIQVRQYSRIQNRGYTPQQYSPPPVQDRQYATRISSHQHSPPIQDRQYSRIQNRGYTPRVRDIDYSPRIRDSEYFPGIQDLEYSQRIRGRENSPRIPEREYRPQIRECEYSPRIRDPEYSPRVQDRLFRDHQYSAHRHEIQERPFGSVSEFDRGSASVEAERSRRVSNRDNIIGRREHDRLADRDREGQFQKLSVFNEAISREESPPMRFKWNHLLTEPANTNINTVKPVGDYGIGSSRMTTERGYRGSEFSDLGQRRVLLEKHVAMKEGNETSFSAFHGDVGRPKTSAHFERSFSSPSKNNPRIPHKDEDCHLHSEKPSARQAFEEEDKSYFYSTQYTSPASHSKTFPVGSSGVSVGFYHESYNDHLTPLSGYGRSSGIPTDLVGLDGYGQTTFCKSPVNSEEKPKDVMDHHQVDLSFMEEKSKDRIYPKLRRSEGSDRRMLSDEYYEKLTSGGQDYANRDSLRTGIMDPSVDRAAFTESSSWEHLREGRPWDQQHPYLTSRLGASGTSHANMRDEEVSIPKSSYLEFGAEVCQDYESLRREKDYKFERDGGVWAYEEKSKESPICDPGVREVDYSSQRRVTARKLDLHKEKMLKSRPLVDKNLGKRKLGNKLLRNRKFAGKIPTLRYTNDQWTRRDVGSVSSTKSAFSRLNYKKTGRAFNGMASHRLSESDDWSSSPTLSALKRRAITGVHKSASTNLKKLVRPLPWTMQAPQSNMRGSKLFKSHKKSMVKSSDSPHAHKDSSPEVEESPAKSEPPEGSEDFRQLVHIAFLKFVKQLNENPAHQKKYAEHGSAGILKCSICGSKSEVFVDTQSLAMHAFNSTTAGIRTQHLGFHKALCLLMGWNSAVLPKSSWVCEALPDAEASTLKEDLIIWPPLVIVHNRSVKNNNPALRVIVSNEGLKAHLTEKGFGGGNAKVCRGKPANQSLMVVAFTGTLSGLQEAERLRKFYAENKRGRAEFQNRSNNRDEETATAALERVLYGYLGLAGDLDKLDFETKKRCVVKSKRDIQAIADAPVTMD